MTSEHIYNFLQKRWNNEITGIPITLNSPSLKRIMSSFDEADRILIAGGTGGGKTTLTFKLIIDAISYSINNKKDIQVIWNCLELVPEEMIIKFLQYIFYKELKKVYSRNDLLNKHQRSYNKQLDDDFKKIQGKLDTFLKYVRFVTCPNPKEFAAYCEGVMDDQYYITKESGKKIIGNKKNSNKSFIIVCDTTDALEGYDKYSNVEAVKQWNKYYTNKLFGNSYRATVINVQQLDNVSQTVMFSNKGERVFEKHLPNVNSLAIDKESPRSHNIVLGLLNPSTFMIPEIQGYKTKDFGHHLNFLFPLKLNFAEKGTGIPLYVDYTKLQYEEIPHKDSNLYEKFVEEKRGINKNLLFIDDEYSKKEEGKDKLNSLLLGE